jgi:FkbM family methyltransferase
VLIEVFGGDVYRLGVDDIGPTPVVVDVGAHVGSFTLAVLERYPGAACFAFEPAPVAFRLLEANMARNGQRVELHAKAVAHESGSAVLLVNDASAMNRLAWEDERTVDSRTLIVPVVSFADVVSDVGGRIDLLKLDCEGAEYDIVERSPSSVWDSVQNIVMEVHARAGHGHDTLSAALSRNGFENRGVWFDADIGMSWWTRSLVRRSEGPGPPR